MKNLIIYFTVFAALSLFGPLTFVKKEKTTVKPVVKNVLVQEKETKSKNQIEFFRVKISEDEIAEINCDEYILGCIAGEMPLNYNDEALKAQGIAAYTFALYKRQFSKNDYDITADYNIDQTFLTDEQLKQKWGDDYSQNRQRLEKLVKSIKGKWLCFEGKPALCVYHAVSCGVTYSAKDVWGTEVPYLKSVDSSYDKLSKDYLSVTELSKKDFCKIIGLRANSDISKIKIENDKSGRVRKISFDEKSFNSSDFAKKLGLKSQNFEIETKDNVVIKTYGYGHGVGMSQYGANCLANGGSSYKEILHHYYSGCSIKD